MKRIMALMLACVLVTALTATTQIACAEDDGVDIGAELTLGNPAPACLTEGEEVPADEGDTGAEEEDTSGLGGNE